MQIPKPQDGPARALARAVATGETSARDVVARALSLVERRDESLQAFVSVAPAAALAAADDVDRRIASGEALPLAGVPFGVKELVAVAGLPRGYGTTAMPRAIAASDAACVRRLRAAGAVPVGVTRTSELAWRDDTPPTRNPLDDTLSCGGSSGGSAAAVSAGLVPLALGTDTGGSIRVPAALCGCCGHKPTYGAVATEGVLPVSPLLDHVGPLARSVDDLRLALAVLTGQTPALAPARDRVRPRIGVPRDDTTPAADPALHSALDALRGALSAAGAALVPIDLPSLEAAYAVVDAVSLAEGCRIFAGALAAPPGALSDLTRSELTAAAALDADALARALQTRERLRAETDACFARHALDAVLLPALAGPAPRRGAPPSTSRLNGPLALANVTGQPSCVVPIRRTPPPLAAQLLGQRGGDDGLLAIAALVEALADDA
jgi:aspartyl-tRNA(Asn)/glutamyl-tRNA(Gln) amidotransferase subunit A